MKIAIDGVELPYEPGDQVYTMKVHVQQATVDCPVCEGKGHYTVNGHRLTCAAKNCFKGQVKSPMEVVSKQAIISGPMRVDQVHVRTSDVAVWCNHWSYPPNRVFISLPDAEAAAKAINEEP